MKRFLFIGEERSERAKKMNVEWEDGKLCAKQLFDALEYCKIDPRACQYLNAFDGRHEKKIGFHYGSLQFVAMGNKVAKWLRQRGMTDFIQIVHPAARGKIRKKENYLAHVKEKLGIE
jgi:hypothetical protein